MSGDEGQIHEPVQAGVLADLRQGLDPEVHGPPCGEDLADCRPERLTEGGSGARGSLYEEVDPALSGGFQPPVGEPQEDEARHLRVLVAAVVEAALHHPDDADLVGGVADRPPQRVLAAEEGLAQLPVDDGRRPVEGLVLGPEPASGEQTQSQDFQPLVRHVDGADPVPVVGEAEGRLAGQGHGLDSVEGPQLALDQSMFRRWAATDSSCPSPKRSPSLSLADHTFSCSKPRGLSRSAAKRTQPAVRGVSTRNARSSSATRSAYLRRRFHARRHR